MVSQSRSVNRTQRELELSRQFTRLVDVIYALVLVQGAINFRAVFTLPGEFRHPHTVLPVLLSLILVYATAIQSFVDYHIASENQPYQFLTKKKRTVDLVRLYVDIAIVASFSFILLKSHVLIFTPSASITPILVALPIVFVLFVIWGVLREFTAALPVPSHNPNPWLLVAFFCFYSVLAEVYILGGNSSWSRNTIFLTIAIGLMVAYRALNWQQNPTCEE